MDLRKITNHPYLIKYPLTEDGIFYKIDEGKFIILLLTNHAGKNEIIAPKELIIAQVAKPRGQ